MQQMNRRFFLRNGALAVAGTTAIPSFLVRSVMAQTLTAPNRRLVVIFQRGAADGLNIVVPYREKNYYSMRPSIAIPQNQVLDLDGFFGLHPSLSSFKPLFDQGHLAVVHAVGSPDMSRSHFDAQDYMESGTPGLKSTQDGWLNRALQSEDIRCDCGHTPFRVVALGADVPRTLAGSIPAIALSNLNSFAIGGRGPAPSPAANAFEAMYGDSGDRIFHPAGEETFGAVKMLRAANPGQYTPSSGANYPNSEFGNNMKQVAQLLKANLGVEAAFTDVSGWDTHQNQGSVNGQLSNRLKDFSDSIGAFWRDLGDSAANVTLVTMSEFGRTARENGTGGTDHGHANAMFVLGGEVKGGKVYGRWPGLDNEQLNEGRDLALTTDYREVLPRITSYASYSSFLAFGLTAGFPAPAEPRRYTVGINHKIELLVPVADNSLIV
jgi:uncharacterized protein (DUF1501 family)